MNRHMVRETLEGSVTLHTTRNGTWMSGFRDVSSHVIDE